MEGQVEGGVAIVGEDEAGRVVVAVAHLGDDAAVTDDIAADQPVVGGPSGAVAVATELGVVRVGCRPQLVALEVPSPAVFREAADPAARTFHLAVARERGLGPQLDGSGMGVEGKGQQEHGRRVPRKDGIVKRGLPLRDGGL